MEWTREITFSVFNDSFATLQTMFPYEYEAGDFIRACMKGEYKSVAISTLKDVENIGQHRMQSTAAKAYPPNDRPRGAADLKSVAWHTRNPASPCVIAVVGDRKIFLDGVHRTVSACVVGSKNIRVFVIKL